MYVGSALRTARKRASFSQAELAIRTGTSQATISAYESGAKVPSLPTLERLLRATGHRITVARQSRRVAAEPTPQQLSQVGRRLIDVIALAEALPVRHEPALRYPRLTPLR